MILERYNDKKRLMQNEDELKLTHRTMVELYRGNTEEDEVSLDLEEHAAQFEELKPYIIYVARNLAKMDTIVQTFSARKTDTNFAERFIISYITWKAPDILCITYFGTLENTEFDAVFQCVEDTFILKSCGAMKDIPQDWENIGSGM